ncbi:MAG: DUF5110 domain-containing protein [Clostridiales bacterium]|nr:DUF5110 domain-containing protein [Clostridiales bacterium]
MSKVSSKIKRFLSLILVSLLVLPFALSFFTACKEIEDTPPGVEKPDPDPDNPNDPSKPDKPNPDDDKTYERYFTVGSVRVGLLSDTVVRVEVKGSKGFEDRDTFYISNRDAVKAPKSTVTESDGYTVISTSSYVVKVPSSAYSLNGVTIESPSGDVLWVYEGDTTPNVYIPSPADELKSWQLNDTPRIIPSDLGYSISDTEAFLQNWDFSNDATDCYVFLPKGDYKKFCEDYITYTGKSELISLQMLGYWDSRWYAYSDETALKQIQDYLDRGYSIDILVIDTDWRDRSSGVGYQINEDLFPNMAEFLEKCHEMGINIIFNDHPEPVNPGTGNLLDDDEVNFRNRSLTFILSLGLDYWWYDRNWHVALNNIDPDISIYATGMYAYQFVTNEYLHTQIDDLNEYAKRALIMGNVDGCLHGRWKYASDASAHKYSIQWTGDIGTDTTALAQEIYASIFGGAEVGIPYMSSDIGGHTSAVTDEMYVRWLQYGALSTICRVHCTSVEAIGQEGRMPWLFGDTAESVAHEYIDMRYRLLPLFYSLSRENYDTGLPIMRRTDIEYPQYMEASRNDQYLLGTNVLVAPIDEVYSFVPESWLTTSNGQPGLTGRYYGDTNLGSLRKTQIDPQINFNWDQGGPKGLGSDNFSISWEGNIRIGPKKSKLMFFADDGIRVFIDGVKVVDGWTVYDRLLETDYYNANSLHTIKVEYFEAGGGAHCYMYYAEESEDGSTTPNTRTVFIPDGTWIDVWTGTRYVGPQTISASHGLETSPIFVREGAVLALAENMKNTSEKDWSKMALDIYAGTTSTETMLYEDDVTTQAYKDGKYRKTIITQEFADGKFTVTVNAAEGEFDGSRAFDEREWNVRIHAREEWGNIKSIRVNGEALRTAQKRSKNAKSSPFAFSGASRDGNVWEFKVNDKVYEKLTIVFDFNGTIEEDEKPDYDDKPAEFTVTTDACGDSLDLSQSAIVDWAHFAADDSGAVARKDVDNHLIGDISTYATPSVYGFSLPYVSWNDGEFGFESNSAVTTALLSQKDFSIKFKTDATKRYYVINLGGEQCIAKLTVRDRAGNAKTIRFGNLTGPFTYRAVIEAKSATATEIEAIYAVQVSKHKGTDTYSSVYIGAVYAATSLPELVSISGVNVTANVTLKNTPSSRSMSSTGTNGEKVVDWRHFDSTLAGEYTSMAGGVGIEQTSLSNPQGFDDYPTTFTWTDGDTTASNAGTTNGVCCNNGTITLIVRVTERTKKILVYTGAWRSDAKITVYNAFYEQIGSASFNGNRGDGAAAATRVADIGVTAQGETLVIIKIECVNPEGPGNVSIAAMQVVEPA